VHHEDDSILTASVSRDPGVPVVPKRATTGVVRNRCRSPSIDFGFQVNDRFFSGLYSQSLNANQVEITVQQGKDEMFYLTVY
jgi:hypothetical protein